MINSEQLNKKIQESGLKKSYLADQLGITSQSFCNKVRNSTYFNIKEIKILIEILNISSEERDKIFFA